MKVVLLTAEGPAFCAGAGLDWPTGGKRGDGPVWDSVADVMR